MSFLSETLAGIRRLLLMDDKVARMEIKIDEAQQNIYAHELRLVRIETTLFGPLPAHVHAPRLPEN